MAILTEAASLLYSWLSKIGHKKKLTRWTPTKKLSKVGEQCEHQLRNLWIEKDIMN